jgi:hypothetical protein
MERQGTGHLVMVSDADLWVSGVALRPGHRSLRHCLRTTAGVKKLVFEEYCAVKTLCLLIAALFLSTAAVSVVSAPADAGNRTCGGGSGC